MRHKISTVISYCTNDYRFLKKCIEEARIFSHEILVPVCDCFYNGEPENKNLLRSSYEENPAAQFIEFPFDEKRLLSSYREGHPEEKTWTHFWHSTARYIGYLHVGKETEYVLFLDVDEIVDGKRFQKWLDSLLYPKKDILRFLCYRYFREPWNQSTTLQRLPIFVKKEALRALMVLDHNERHGIFEAIKNSQDKILFEGKPLFHHYNWVRTKEECLKKTKTWGHFWEENWDEIIEEHFAKPFSGKDFILGHKYKKVPSFFDPFQVALPKKEIAEKKFPNVISVDRKEIVKKELCFEFGDFLN